MAKHIKLPIAPCIFLLLPCIIAAAIADSARPEVQYHEKSLPYRRPRLQDFPNERLFHAYLVIQRFKNTISSDPKNITGTWTGYDICGETTYLGFFCTTPPRATKGLTVTAAFFNGFRLSAPKLQGFIDQLPDVAIFHAASNNFGGDIPVLAGLEYLYELNVANDIPARTNSDEDPRDNAQARGGVTAHGQLGRCITADLNLTFNIGVHRHKGGGIIPSGVTDGKALLLNYNNLSGPLPENIGFSKLSYLALANNKLTGPIPPSMGQLQDSLLEVLLLNNQLSGCLPNELGMLHKATVIDAGMNQLTGPIPTSFSCLSSVEQLNLVGNHLYGQVPDTLCKLAGPTGRLANLTLSGNYFTSVGPACAALIKDGVLNVKNNCIPGLDNQRRPAECAAFHSQPKTCPAASTQQVACPAAAVTSMAPAERKARDYSSYVTYATLHE